jgi:hypothetical protein
LLDTKPPNHAYLLCEPPTMITQSYDLSLKDRQVLWLFANKGVIRRLAKQFGVSSCFASSVWRGEAKSGGLRIEKALAELGAPGFEQYLEAPSSVPPAEGSAVAPAEV